MSAGVGSGLLDCERLWACATALVCLDDAVWFDLMNHFTAAEWTVVCDLLAAAGMDESMVGKLRADHVD